MVSYKVLYNDHAGCPSFGQVHASMSLWVSSHKRCNRKVYTLYEGLVIVEEYFRIVKTFQVNRGNRDSRL